MINLLTTLRNSAIIGVSSIVLAAASLPAQALNLVQNGGFSSNSLATSSIASGYVGGGSVTIDDWTISKSYTFLISDGTTYATNINAASYGPDPIYGTAITAPGGGPVTFYGSAAVNSPTGSGWYLASDGAYGDPATISQTISGLTAGENYTLTFYQASAQQSGFSGASTDDFQVTFGGSTQTSATLSQPSQSAVSGWQQQTMTFTADSTSDTLQFLVQGAPSGEPPFALLTGVSLQSASTVPWEMDALPVVGSTICFLGFGLWSKQKIAQKKLK